MECIWLGVSGHAFNLFYLVKLVRPLLTKNKKKLRASQHFDALRAVSNQPLPLEVDSHSRYAELRGQFSMCRIESRNEVDRNARLIMIMGCCEHILYSRSSSAFSSIINYFYPWDQYHKMYASSALLILSLEGKE